MRIKILYYLLFSFLISCASSSKPPIYSLTITTFNVETLFDAKDDPDKNDATYLPLKFKNNNKHKLICQKARFPKWVEQCLNWDWNEEVVRAKLSGVAQTLKHINKGRGPDILLLQEVENKSILEQLNKEYALGFKEIVLIEGKDLRGIDVAIMSKWPLLGKPQLHFVPFKEKTKDRLQDTRGVLEATFELPDKTPLTVFAAHFPAPFHPVQMRMDSLEYLSVLLSRLPSGQLAVAGGDFNIPLEEDQQTQILEKYASPYWWVAHKVGCKKCRGTTYYAKKDTWSFLDVLLVSKSFARSSWRFDKNSVRVINEYDQQKDEQGRPLAFDPTTKTGVSDHFPLAFDIFQ